MPTLTQFFITKKDTIGIFVSEDGKQGFIDMETEYNSTSIVCNKEVLLELATFLVNSYQEMEIFELLSKKERNTLRLIKNEESLYIEEMEKRRIQGD